MSDDKRTFEATAHLQPDPRLQTRRPKGKKQAPDHSPGMDTAGPFDQESLPVTQDLIMRLIKLLKET